MPNIELRASMIVTLTAIIGLSTLFFTVALSLLNSLSFLRLAMSVIPFNIIQWFISPYIIDALYGVQDISDRHPALYDIVAQISQRTGIRMPRVMIANIPIPNAFTYGSPLAGTRIAITTGLLRTLEPEEVQAVIGHELGHSKHNDAQIMMFVTILPAILYYLGYSFLISSQYRNNRERSSGAALLGSVSMLLYFVLTLLSLQLSRLREYYADRHCITVVDDGARKLSEALGKIVRYTGELGRVRNIRAYSNFKALFITDPDTSEKDTSAVWAVKKRSDQELVQRILSNNVSTFDSFVEILSTHPNIIKRLRMLQLLQ